MNCRMKMMFSILLFSMCPTWSFAQTTGNIGASGGPPGGSSIGGPPLGGKLGSGDIGGEGGMAGPGGMRGGGGMPGGMPGGRSGSGSVPGRIKLTFPGGDSSAGGEGGGGGGYDGMAGGMSGGGMGQPVAFEMDGKTYSVSRAINFQYVPNSFRPTKQIAGQASYGGMGGVAPAMMGAPGGSTGGYGGGGMGMPGGGFGGPGMGGGGGFSGAPAAESGMGGVGDDPSFPPADILALVIDGELVNDRTRIELVVPGLNGVELFRFPFHSSAAPHLPEPGAKFTWVSESEIKLVSDIIRQTIWMEDALKLIRQSKGQGAVAASNEKLLKQLLAEQYDTQITRRELEAESIKNRLDALQEELKRRKLAKDRVVEVQWGRLILDAQGLLNKE